MPRAALSAIAVGCATTSSALRSSRSAADRVQRALDLSLVEGDVLEVAGEVVVVRGHVEVPVAREVEEDRPLLAGLVGFPRDLERAVDRVRRLGRGDYALGARKADGRG